MFEPPSLPLTVGAAQSMPEITQQEAGGGTAWGPSPAPRHRSGCGRAASPRPHWAENIHFRCLSAAIKAHNADGRAGGAHGHAAGGAGAAAGGVEGGRTGCPARPGVAAAGRARLRGRYARAEGAGTSCVPRRLGVAPGCWTAVGITHRKTSLGCRMRLSLVMLFSVWHRRLPAAVTSLGIWDLGQRICAKGETDCGYSSGSSAGHFPCGVCRYLQELGEGLLVLSGS